MLESVDFSMPLGLLFRQQKQISKGTLLEYLVTGG